MRTSLGIFVFWHFKKGSPLISVNQAQRLWMTVQNHSWIQRKLKRQMASMKMLCLYQLILSWERLELHLALGPSHLWSRQPVCTITPALSGLGTVFNEPFSPLLYFPALIMPLLRDTWWNAQLLKCPLLSLLLFQGSVPRKEVSGYQELYSLIFHSDRSWVLFYTGSICSLTGSSVAIWELWHSNLNRVCISQSPSSCTQHPCELPSNQRGSHFHQVGTQLSLCGNF